MWVLAVDDRHYPRSEVVIDAGFEDADSAGAQLGRGVTKCPDRGKLRLAGPEPVDRGRPALLSNWERGECVPTPEDVASVLGALGVVGERKARIMSLARSVAGSSWFLSGAQAWATLVAREQEATSMTVWAPLLIPDLLQIPDYARLAFGPGLRGVLEHVVEDRLSRNRILFGPEAIEAQMFVGTEALRNHFGDAEVMLRQAQYLRELAEISRTVTIRVVPNQAMTEDAFSWYQQRDSSEVVYCPHHRGRRFLDWPEGRPVRGNRRTIGRVRVVTSRFAGAVVGRGGRFREGGERSAVGE